MIFGLTGVWLAVPVADFLSISITGIWMFREIRSFNKAILGTV
jgi:Na+-driven multidrug efflux pump